MQKSSQGTAVIGCGVVGLSTAILLAKKGYRSTIYASEISPNTTSDAACAVWEPFAMSPPNHVLNASQLKILKDWGTTSWEHFKKLEKSNCGLRRITFFEILEKEEEEPFYKDIVRNFEEGPFHDGPEEFVYQQNYGTYVIEMPKYMKWLRNEFLRLGGKVVMKKLITDDIEQLPCKALFNCSGLGSRSLFGDNTFRPIKGQLLLFRPKNVKIGIGTEWFIVLPRSDCFALGRLLIEGDESLEEDKEGTEKLFDEAQRWSGTKFGKMLGLRKTELQRAGATGNYKVNVGIRPVRENGPRLEREIFRGKVVYHDYGHGGSGVAFSWGCAEATVKSFESDLSEDPSLF